MLPGLPGHCFDFEDYCPSFPKYMELNNFQSIIDIVQHLGGSAVFNDQSSIKCNTQEGTYLSFIFILNNKVKKTIMYEITSENETATEELKSYLEYAGI